MSFLTVFLGLVFIILIHELGHFLSAKFFGIKVEEFGFGFPPRLFGKKIGETIYSLNWIPFGGFVRISGELPSDNLPSEIIPEEKNNSADSKMEIDIFKKSISEEGIEIMEEKITFSENPALSEKSREFNKQKIWKRAVVISAGVIFNIISAWFLFSLIFMVGAPTSVIVAEVLPSSPAEIAGLLKGDKIVDFESSEKFIYFLAENEGKSVSLKVQRGEEFFNLSVLSRANAAPSEGRIGASLVDSGIPKSSFFGSFLESAKFTASSVVYIISSFFSLLKNLFTGGGFNVVGPVGIFSIASVVAESGFLYIIHLVGMISLNLAVLNILPFPALDGGRLIFLLAEKIKGSPLPAKFEILSNAIGFSLLILLMVLVSIRDVSNLF